MYALLMYGDAFGSVYRDDFWQDKKPFISGEVVDDSSKSLLIYCFRLNSTFNHAILIESLSERKDVKSSFCGRRIR
jgi:hypothetical protein